MSEQLNTCSLPSNDADLAGIYKYLAWTLNNNGVGSAAFHYLEVLYRAAKDTRQPAEGWISVDERLPEEGVPVLVQSQHWHTKGTRMDVATRVKEDDCVWRVDGCEMSHDWDVVHWRPLPSGPEVE